MHGTYFSNSEYEILEIKDGCCYVRNKKTNKYYFKKELNSITKSNYKLISKCQWCIKDTIYTVFIALSLVFVFDLIFRYKIFQKDIVYSYRFTIGMAIYIIFNLVIHELGHSLVLKSWGRQIGKYKFKFKFIFPIVSVDTSDAYMLPTFRKICVFSAGIVINIFTCWLTALFCPNWIGYVKVMMSIVIFNIIPIGYVRTDGYNIINSFIKNTNMTKKIRVIYDKICKVGFLILTILVIMGILYKLY